MRRERAVRLALLFAVTALAELPVSARAQGGADVPSRQGQLNRGPRTAADSIQARKDSVKNAPLVNWVPADSAGLAMMGKKGYQLVRYQSEQIIFGATSRTITLIRGKNARAAVLREPTLLLADTIEYADSSKMVFAAVACGDTITIHDPSRNDDINAGCSERLSYDMERREGKGGLISTSTKSGATWFVKAHSAAFSSDTSEKEGNAFYGRDGEITSCDDSLPHYHFRAQEIKRIGGSVMVARPAILYIEDIPVMWFPFIFQDSRSGRHSGILTPQFGLSELLRNSPDYRRTVFNTGYYFALSDYYDAQVSMDWRSGAKATDVDPGWVWYHGTIHYKWLDRFLSGTLSASEQNLSNGSSNFSLSWQHVQNFSLASRLTMNLNYTTNTTVQRQTAINPIAPLATILSQVGYSRDLGAFSLQVGGERRQYPGRPQIDENYPSINLTAKPLNVTSWLLWTPSFTFTSNRSLHIDAQGDFSQRFVTRSDGSIDSTKVDRTTHNTQIALATPFKIGDFQVTAAIRAGDTEADYPQLRTILNPLDTAARTQRVYQRTYLETVDFDFSVAVPQLIKGPVLSLWNITPNVSISNVDPAAYFVRTERTGARWVSQSKRLSYGLSVSPTFYGIFDGFGPVTKIRHSINPSLAFSYSPQANVSTDYLLATGRSPNGYLGALAQKQATLTLVTNIEAKLKQGGDSGTTHPELAKKINIISVNFTPLTWDFERAQQTHKTGFSTDQFGYTLRSELLPGFDFGSDYSLFQGSVLSDSAKFSPYLTSIHASFNLSAKSPIVHLINRLLGLSNAAGTADTARSAQAPATQDERIGQMQTLTGPNSPSGALNVPTGRGFDASITFTKNQQRPPVGGNVIQFDPTVQCAGLKALNPIQYDICVRNALAAPPIDTTNSTTTAGGSVFRYPPQMNVQFRTSFNLTEKWSASWSSNYDLQLSQFGSQTVSLARELHDWRAVFGFTQAPNGNFSFTFFISLKAQQDVKFNYNRSDYRVP